MPWLLRVLVVLLLAATMPAAGAVAIEPAVRDRVVPAAVQVAFDVTWIEDGVGEPAPYPAGSGTIVSPDGLVLTNAHVVDPFAAADMIREAEATIRERSPGVSLRIEDERFVLFASDGKRAPRPAYLAELAAIDPELDLAVLRIVGGADGAPLPPGITLPHVAVGDSDDLGLGDPVHIFGYPGSGGDALTYTTGVVSGFNYDDDPDSPAWINTDAVMSGGSSGGTAVNDDGELIGVPTQGSTLDCRPGDTDGDGELTAADVGCIPTGGSIGQIRPVALAAPLLAQAEEGGLVVMVGPADSAPPPFNHGSTFDYAETVDPIDDEDVRAEIRDGAFVIEIKRPGLFSTWAAPEPTRGASFGYRLTLGEIVGDGQLTIRLTAEDQGATWGFMIDPLRSTWELVREGQDGSLFTWVEPRSYAAMVDGALRNVEVRVSDGAPTLLVNGEDVVAPTGVEMPAIDGSLEVAFGAGIASGRSSWTGQPFVVHVLEVRGYQR